MNDSTTFHRVSRIKTAAAAVLGGAACAWAHVSIQPASAATPIAPNGLLFEESDGVVAVEAEHFFRQTANTVRAWHLTTGADVPGLEPDGDPPHVAGASGGAYLEILPDTRRTHADRLISGENFSNAPGVLGILSYRVHFNTPGRYYVWVRAYSTGSEDNGLHVGLNGTWPESGQRMQWCEGKRSWRWDSKQRTARVHCGEPYRIYLDIPEPGEHVVEFSMREDGFEFDKWMMTRERLESVEGAGPEPGVRRGRIPAPFPSVAAAADPGVAVRADGTGTAAAGAANRQPDGTGKISVGGELKQWHRVSLTMDGPFAHERDTDPNPFTDYRMQVRFTHETSGLERDVPGYFAADGAAAETGAEAGTRWRANLSPDRAGRWDYSVSFLRGDGVAVGEGAGTPVAPYDGQTGSFVVEASGKTGTDFRARGRLSYIGGHHLRFAGSGEFFLKAGPDAPETLLAYRDFDGTVAGKDNVPLKSWAPHTGDWHPGDPVWRGDRGKGLIGALNYLSSKGVNSLSFLPYNAGGDGDNVWPFVERNAKLQYDCSKLDQWGIVFDHATALGLHLHFKLQENEIDDNRRGHERKPGEVPESLDGGRLGPERKLYCRELVARFAHVLALNWNIGEENTQSTDEIRDMAAWLREVDPYDHPIVIHTFPGAQDQVYTPLLGRASALTGASLQNSWKQVHQRTLKWIRASAAAGVPWVVANDEQNPANLGVPPDPGYKGFSGVARARNADDGYTLHDIRKYTLWGNLMAGGAGVEYYFGYQLPQNDLVCEDFRSRDKSWDYCRIALRFFEAHRVPFWEMSNADGLVGNERHTNSRYCLAKPGSVYLVYLPTADAANPALDLSGTDGRFEVRWFDPRIGGPLQRGSVRSVSGGGTRLLGGPPAKPEEDWLVIVNR